MTGDVRASVREEEKEEDKGDCPLAFFAMLAVEGLLSSDVLARSNYVGKL